MAKFSKLVITEKGKELCAKSLVSSEKIQFTKMLASSTKYEESALSELESLNNVRQTETVRSMTKEGNCIQLDTVFSNKSLEEEYILNTVGLCAQLGAGQEVLFAVSTETANGIPMPKMFFTVTDIQLRLSIYMENADNVQIIVDTGAMATVSDVIDLRAYVDINIENIGQDITSSADAVYQQSTGYTDTKIAELINGAPSTLDTLGEIAQAMQENENVVDALESAIGSKAPQAELDGHTGNSTIHITASERTKWNNKMEKTGNASNTTAAFTQASSLANISTGEKISVIMGKVSKAVATLISHIAEKATGSKFGHVKLSDTYKSAVSNGAAANGMGASQKALADAYAALNNNLTDSLGGITFGVDANGNYGYIKAGADTVTPFSGNRELTLYASDTVTYIFLLDSVNYDAYNVYANGGNLNSSRAIIFRVPSMDSKITIRSTDMVVKSGKRLAYCFRADKTISGPIERTINATGIDEFTLKEISEQYPDTAHGELVGFGLYQYDTNADFGAHENNALNSIVTW